MICDIQKSGRAFMVAFVETNANHEELRGATNAVLMRERGSGHVLKTLVEQLREGKVSPPKSCRLLVRA